MNLHLLPGSRGPTGVARRVREDLPGLRRSRYGPEVLAVACLLIAALAIRVVSLDSIPTNITADEADNLSTVFRIRVAGEPGPFGLDWKPQPAMSAYIFDGFMRTFGDTIYGMRMASAFLSTLALIPFYILARQVVRPVPAVAATLMLATGQWYLHFSRSGWENVHVALYALCAALAVSLALRRVQLRWFVGAGVATALGLYGYFAGRTILASLLVYAPLAWYWAKGARRLAFAGYGVLLIISLVLFLPQVPAIADNWEEFNQRTSKVFVLNQPRPFEGETSDAGILAEQTKRTVKGFFLLDGDVFSEARYGPDGEALYDLATGVLFLAGLALSLRRMRQTGLWWCMLLIPLLATQVLSADTPDGARAVIIAPFIYLFIALVFDDAIRVTLRRSYSLRRVASVGIVALALVIGVWNVHSYFDWIQSPEAAEARQPAVELEHYDLWKSTFIEGLRTEGADFHLRDWDERVEEIERSE